MTIATPGIAAVRISIENAVRLQPMLDPPPPAIAPAEPTNLPRHRWHLARRFAEKLPIGFCGMAEAAPELGMLPYSIDARLYLYRDCNGLPRSLDFAGHDRDGLASLFAGDAWLLARLWPARRGGWDPATAAE